MLPSQPLPPMLALDLERMPLLTPCVLHRSFAFVFRPELFKLQLTSSFSQACYGKQVLRLALVAFVVDVAAERESRALKAFFRV